MADPGILDLWFQKKVKIIFQYLESGFSSGPDLDLIVLKGRIRVTWTRIRNPDVEVNREGALARQLDSVVQG